MALLPSEASSLLRREVMERCKLGCRNGYLFHWRPCAPTLRRTGSRLHALMKRKSLTFIGALVAIAVPGATYAYDASNEGRIANGVAVAGVDVGGLEASEAKRKLQRSVAASLRVPIRATHGKKRFILSADEARIRVDVRGMVAEAVRVSRDGNVLSRTVRDLSGGQEDSQIPVRVAYSRAAADRFVRRVRRAVERPAKDATLDFPSLDRVKERDGVRLRARRLRAEIGTAMTRPHGRPLEVPTEPISARVTREDLAEKYPVVLVVDRPSFKLRLYRKLKLSREYTVAIGQQGYETPSGTYEIQNKGVNVAWSVPNSPWAGDLAGQVIPGGAPDNPLKARWLGIYDGVGIHGTDEDASIGTAASRGCIRMRIPEVIELYDQVPLSTPIFIA